MPFDGTKQYPLSRDRLYQLVKALRQPMPEGFYWDFSIGLVSTREYRAFPPEWHMARVPRTACGSVGCAIGLARVMWPDFNAAYLAAETRDDDQLAEMDSAAFRDIFWHAYSYERDWRATPADVADKLEAYLNESQAGQAKE